MSFVIDDDGIEFSRSDCDCKVCREYDQIDREWKNYVPQTALQKRMKSVIKRIEKRERKGRK